MFFVSHLLIVQYSAVAGQKFGFFWGGGGGATWPCERNLGGMGNF